jgi:hypothetical protein
VLDSLSHAQVVALNDNLKGGGRLETALPTAVGEFQTDNGLWRFYSRTWPGQGTAWWNTASPWKQSWARFLREDVFAFAEDVFGNQLVLVRGRDEVHMLNHENADSHSLLVGPSELLTTVLDSGFDWIDFYEGGVIQLARQFGEVPRDSHLHWKTPLILGGAVNKDNICLLPRDPHHIGHAKLWGQLSDLPPGTRITTQF